MTPKTLKIIPCALALVAIAGCSDNSNPLGEGTLDTVPPAVPANVELQAHRGGNPSLEILWTPNAEADLAGYVVQRSLDEGDTWVDATAVITTNEFVDTYYSKASYRVSAVDLSENQSAFSSTVSYLAANGTPKLPQDAQGQIL
jgi:hypothetical protein